MTDQKWDRTEVIKKLTALGFPHVEFRCDGTHLWVCPYYLEQSIAQQLAVALESGKKTAKDVKTEELAALAGFPYEESDIKTAAQVFLRIETPVMSGTSKISSNRPKF